MNIVRTKSGESSLPPVKQGTIESIGSGDWRIKTLHALDRTPGMGEREIVPDDRSRIGWWLLTLAVGALVAFILSFVIKALVLGLFIYYTMRPLYERIHRVIRSPGVAAAVALVGVALPLLAVLVYVGLRAVQEALRAQLDWLAVMTVVVGPATATTLQTFLRTVEQPGQPIQFDVAQLTRSLTEGSALLGPTGNVLVTVFLAAALAFFLLRDDDRLVRWFRSVLGGSTNSTLDTYLRAVDNDLESIYLGNVATAFLVGIGATVVYNGFNVVAPPAIRIPLPMMLGVLTGLASLVPIVVSKLVYVPLSLYLATLAARSPVSMLPVVGLFVVSLLFLDLFPQLVLRPYLAGRRLHVGLVMFSYIAGTLAFGWEGLFLGPLVLVVGLHLLSIVVPELVHGEPVTPAGLDFDPFVPDSDDEPDDDTDDAGDVAG